LTSAERLIFRRPRIGRPADDTRAAAVYGLTVRARRLHPRLGPVELDYLVAAVLTVVAQVEIWFTSEDHSHRLWGALVVTVLTMSVAIRRRYPALVGTLVPVFAASQHALALDPQIIASPVANFCALYALAVWTPTRQFRAGLALVVAADIASGTAPGGSLRSAVA
jgi:hypothetical protein